MRKAIHTGQFLLLAALAIVPAFLGAQKLDPAMILHPAPDSWPTYSGDYSGTRYVPLKEINTANVHGLTLAWTQRLSGGAAVPASAPFGPAAAPVKTIVGGVGTNEAPMGSLKGAELVVDGVMYVTTPGRWCGRIGRAPQRVFLPRAKRARQS